MRLGWISNCLCSACLIAASTALAADDLPHVTIELAEDFPTELPTIVAGTLDRDANAGSAFTIRHPSLDRPLAGQAEAGSRRAYVAAPDGVGSLFRRQSSPLEKHVAEQDSRPLPVSITKPSDRTDHVNIQASDDGFTFLAGDRAVLFYQREPVTQHNHARAGYVHPLIGLDGEVFTEVFPKDHRHHQGVFWAWHQLWVGDRKIGDPWVAKDHLVVVKKADIVEQGPVFATLDIHAEWKSTALNDSGQSKAIVAEQTRIRVFRATRDVQYVDFTIQLTPLVDDVKIGGSEDIKGYSGFTVRVKPPRDMVIRDASGVLESDAVQSASPWAGVSGSFAEGKTSGAAILSHASLSQFPPRWVLRHYGMQNVAYPGREPIALRADTPLVIRHRLVLHRGSTDEVRIADHQRIYELTP